MLTINKSYTGFNLSMPIAQSKRKLIAATALFIAVGALTGAIATGGAATVSFAQTEGQTGGAAAGQQGGGGGEARIIRQGVSTSEPNPLPGQEEGQRIVILPLRQEGVYSGVLTYTATQPVEVVVLDVLQLNATERSILNATEDGFGALLTSPLDNQTMLGLTVITPTYGDTPIPSASIPFAGNAVWLHTLSGEPFAASYAVSAQVLPGEVQNHISNATLALAAGAAEEEDGGGAAEEEDGGGAAADEGGATADGAAADEGGATADEGGATADEEDGAAADEAGTTGGA